MDGPNGFIPGFPDELRRQGWGHHVPAMVGHNMNEGALSAIS